MKNINLPSGFFPSNFLKNSTKMKNNNFYPFKKPKKIPMFLEKETRFVNG